MVPFLNTSFATLCKDDQLEKEKSYPSPYHSDQQCLSDFYSRAVCWFTLIQWVASGQFYPTGWFTPAPDTRHSYCIGTPQGWTASDYSDEWLAFECRRVGFFKTVGFLMEAATFNAVYAARTVRSRSPATATNISDNSNHKIHIQFRIWMSISFVLGCEIQLRFSWQIISKASVITGPRPFSARNWITAHRKLENRQVKRNILKKNANGKPFQQKAVT